MEIIVKGHSGCQIDIINNGSKLYINKSTFDPQYVNRLYLQAKKQCEAAKKSYQHIRIPEIYEINRHEDHLTIKMEYIYSKNFVDYFEDAGFDNINYFIKALRIFIDSEIEKSILQNIDTMIIKKKYEDVCYKCQSNPYLANDIQIIHLLEKSRKIFNQLPNCIEIPIGQCHGDLTFSNILFNGNNYYLIDFLDSFIESPLIDLVKIRQDSKYKWSQLMYNGKLDVVRLSIISQKIDKEIDKYYTTYDWYEKYYTSFQLMNFLRILQYAKENKVIAYLKNVLESMI